MIKIKLILGGEDGKLFGELLFLGGGSVEHALLSPSYTHISPSQCRGKFPTHHLSTPGGVDVSLLLRLCGGAEVCLCLPQKYFIVMSFPVNNLPFPPLRVPKWKSRGKNKSLNPIAQNLGVSACVGALFITVTIQCLDDGAGEKC